MVKQGTAVRAVREYNENSADDKSAVVDNSDPMWDTVVRVRSESGIFGSPLAKLLVELDDCVDTTTDDEELFVY